MAATIEGILKEVRQAKASSGDISARIQVEFNALGNLEVIQELNKICQPDKLVKVIVLGEDEWDDFTITAVDKDAAVVQKSGEVEGKRRR